MTQLQVGVLFERQDNAWVGSCPSVPGAVAGHASLPECRKRLSSAIESMLLYASAGDLRDLEDLGPSRVIGETLGVESPERAAVDLVTQSDIARLAGVSRQAVSQWVRSNPDFPAPNVARGSHTLWERAEVLEWLKSDRRASGRPRVRLGS